MQWPPYRTLSLKEKRLLIVLLVVAVTVFAYRVVWARQWPYYRELKAQLADHKTQLAAAREDAGRLESLREELSRLEAEMEEWKEQAVIALETREDFLTSLQPQQEGLEILALHPQEPQERGSLTVYPFQVVVVGAYPEVKEYLRQVEGLPALTTMQELKIAAKTGNSGLVEATFVVEFCPLPGGETRGGLPALSTSGRADLFRPPAGAHGGPGEEPGDSLAPAVQTLPSRQVQATPPAPAGDCGDAGEAGPAAPEYSFPARGTGRPRAGAPWLEGMKVLRNVGPFYYPADRRIAIGGREFDHGVVADLEGKGARAEAVLDLGGGYAKLRGFLGVEDTTMNTRGNFVLRIKGDERELFASSPLGPGRYPQYVELSVAGVNRLVLQVEWVEGQNGEYDLLRAALANIIFVTPEEE